MRTPIHTFLHVHQIPLNRRDQEQWSPQGKGTKRWGDRELFHCEYPFVPFEF